ncbi:MAG: sulfotransferase family protein [Microthrixaceae bacterium]
MTTTDPVGTPDELVQAAIDSTGLDDFGEPTWREGMELFAESLAATADLNELGVGIARDGVVGDLATRLRLVDWRARHPEVAAQRIERPIIIVGLPRTGTSILHDLMAQDPSMRAPLSWEVERPVPPPRTETYETDPRIAEAQAQFDLVDSLIPGFTAFHELGARLAQEDVRMWTSEFRSMQFSLQFEVPEYNEWLLHTADMAPAYRWHHRFLQHLQSEHMVDRWLLKSPAHLWNFAELAAEYPDAIVIQNHRDPLKVIASISALGASLREMTTDSFEVQRLAAQYGEDIMFGLDRALAQRRDGLFPEDQVIDVRYQDFRTDLLGTVAAIYDRLGLELTDEAAARQKAFLDAHPGDAANSLRRYKWEQTGLDEGEMRERASAYQEYFGIESEPLS